LDGCEWKENENICKEIGGCEDLHSFDVCQTFPILKKEKQCVWSFLRVVGFEDNECTSLESIKDCSDIKSNFHSDGDLGLYYCNNTEFIFSSINFSCVWKEDELACLKSNETKKDSCSRGYLKI
jgi:hypothetical protein